MSKRSTRRGLPSAVAAGAACVLALACGGGDDASARDAADHVLAEGPAQPAAPVRNRAPVIERVQLEPDGAVAGDSVVALVQAQDPDGDPYDLGFTWYHGQQPVEGGEASMVLPPGVRRGEMVQVEVRASDGKANSAPVRAYVTVGNRAPQWRTLALDAAEPLTPGTAIEIVSEVVDPDEDRVQLEIEWYVNDELLESARDAKLDTSELERGDRVRARVVATDGTDRSAARETPVMKLANRDPEIISAPGTFTDDGRFRYAVDVDDADGDRTFRYRLVRAPAGMTIDPLNGEVDWKADASQVGVHSVEVAAADRHGGEGRQVFELTVTPADEEAVPAAPGD